MVSARPLDALRFPLRTAGFVGLTFGMYGLLEVDTAISPAADREVVLHTWMRRYGRALLKLYGLDVRAGGLFQGELASGRAAGAADPAGAGYCPGRDAAGLGRLFVMNHRSALDIMITLAFFEATVVSRADLARMAGHRHGGAPRRNALRGPFEQAQRLCGRPGDVRRAQGRPWCDGLPRGDHVLRR